LHGALVKAILVKRTHTHTLLSTKCNKVSGGGGHGGTAFFNIKKVFLGGHKLFIDGGGGGGKLFPRADRLRSPRWLR
jgi:hypothetical protein